MCYFQSRFGFQITVLPALRAMSEDESRAHQEHEEPEYSAAMVGTGRSSSDGGRHKKRGVRSAINVLLLGDEQVGKSSLISTFVSRHFSETVPGIMTSVRLPPDPNNSSCITTIIDSQGGDAALLSAVQQYMSLSQSQSGSTTSLLTVSEHQQHSPQPSPRGSTSTYSRIGAGGSVSAGIDNVDSIVLVYDLDRVETFYRLENHWLPLIEKCYNGDVSHTTPNPSLSQLDFTNTLLF
eukprot:scaffold25922_cov55-Attheya_sp.AAC.4